MYNQYYNVNINNLKTCYIQTMNNVDNDINSDNDSKLSNSTTL